MRPARPGCCTRAVFNVNITAFELGFKAWIAAQELKALHTFRNLAGAVYHAVVMETPQYSGTTVGNWRFSINAVDTSADAKQITLQPYSKASTGSPNSVRTMSALFAGLAGVDSITSLSDKVFISNHTDFGGEGVFPFHGAGEHHTLGELETSPGWLRAVNQPGAMMGRAVSYYTSVPVTSIKGYGV